SDIRLAIYGQKNRWQMAPVPLDPTSLDGESWIGPDTHMGDATLEKWMMGKSTGYKLDSMLGIQLAVRQGAGIAVLPCYLGDSDEELIRLTKPVEELTTQLWFLTHPDLRYAARVQVFMKAITEAVREQTD
ncbi:MAG: LysR substrate-binding domain-containing protein, partial [Halomonas sp.]